MTKYHLAQVKIFKLSDYDTSESIEKVVNNYIIEAFNIHGNSPRIETSSTYISVIVEQLCEVNK